MAAPRLTLRRSRPVRIAVRWLVGLVVALSIVGLIADPASAHAGLEASTPISDQVLSSPPSEVRLTFTEPVDAGIGGVQVLDPDGNRVDIGRVNTAADGATLIVPIDPAPQGTHTVSWRVVSSDGHTVTGAYVFHVGRRTGGASVEASNSASLTTAVEWVGRFGVLAGLVVLLGALWIGGPRGLASLERLQRASALALLGGSVLVLWSRGAEAGGRPLWRAAGSVGALVSNTWAGGVDVARIGLALLAVVLVWRRAWLVVTAVSFSLMTTLPVGGHAWSTEPVAVAVLADATHLAAASVWAGGLIALVVTLRASGVAPAWAAGMVRQASKGFVLAAPIVIVSGVVSTSVHIGGPGDLVDTAWGRTVLVKMALTLVLLGLGWRHRGRLERAVESGLFRLGSLSFEGAAFVVALAATSLLVSLVPAEIALDRPFSERRTTPGGLVQLDVSPARGGSNDLHLAFLADATTDRPVDAVRVVISTEGVAERGVPVQQDGASHAFATAVSFGPPGTWRVVVTSVLRGQPETVTFEVELR